LVERYGPQAHPDVAVNVRCEEIASLVEVAAHSDAVLLAIRASAPDLVELPMEPPLAVAARLGLVTLARRTPPASLELVCELMAQHFGGRRPARLPQIKTGSAQGLRLRTDERQPRRRPIQPREGEPR
jgi:hypothetical protein